MQKTGFPARNPFLFSRFSDRRLIPALFLAFVLLSACSDGGKGVSSTTPPPATRTLTGVIEDPAIEDALVYLEGSAQVTRSDAEGRFTLEIPSVLRTPGILRSQGGKDRGTALLFDDIALACPLSLFAEGEPVVLSPATTLLTAVLARTPDTADAKARVSAWLGLPPDLSLLTRPAQDPRMLRRTILLSRLAALLTTSGAPFDQLADLILEENSPPLLDTGENLLPQTLERLPEIRNAQQTLETLYSDLQAAGGDSLRMIRSAREHFLAAALTGALENTLAAADARFQERRQVYGENMRILAQVLADREGAFADTAAMARFLRYLLPTTLLLEVHTSNESPTGFLVSGPLAESTVQAAALSAFLDAPLVGEILQTRTPYQVAVPLLAHEHPGNDNAKRIRYYFSSSLSPVLQAERLADKVYDDETRDGVLAQVVAIRARAGFFDEAENLLDTRMYDGLSRVSARTDLALAQIRWKRPEDGRRNLEKAEEELLERIRHKGGASVNADDLSQFLRIQGAWADLQDTQAMQRLFDTLHQQILGKSLDATNHGRLTMAARSTVDAFMEENPPLAGQTPAPGLAAGLKTLEELAASTPANESKGQRYYKLRTFMLVETALRHVRAGLHADALRIIQGILSLREKDGLLSDTPSGPQALNLTFQETHAYMPDVTALLFAMDRENEALAAAASIPDTPATTARHRARAFAQGADYHVRKGDLNTAITLVETHVRASATHPDETLAEKIRFLTYETPQIPKGAEILLQKGDRAGARVLLEKALIYADQMEDLDRAAPKDWISRKLSRGYARIAPLLVRADLGEKAKTLLSGTRQQISSAFSAVDAMNAWKTLARSWDACGETLEADLAFGHAEEALKNQFGLRKPLDVLETGLGLLSDLTESQRTEKARDLALFLSSKVELILDEAGEDADSLNKATADAASLRVRLARQFREAGWPDLTAMELDTAYATALGILNENDRIQVLTLIAEGYALIKETRAAIRTADHIPYLARKNAAYLSMGKALAGYDAFPMTPVASVDTDKDGRPDFFHPLASETEIAASGLEMDMDCDGDGVPDTEDPTPLYRNP